MSGTTDVDNYQCGLVAPDLFSILKNLRIDQRQTTFDFYVLGSD